MTQKLFFPQIALLSLLQGLLLTNNVTLIAINGLAGFALTSNKALATLPVTFYLLGSALAAMPAAKFMRRYGRSNGFQIGTLGAALGCLIGFFAVRQGSMIGLCIGTLIAGIYPAFCSSFRFAAAEVADAYRPDAKSKAISWVLMGGVLGGVVGPEFSKLTRSAMPGLFSATYLSLTFFALLAMVLIRQLKLPEVKVADDAKKARPLFEILSQRLVWIAVLAGVVAYGIMNLLMVATPLAMEFCKLPYSDAAFVLEWHVIGMFLPGLFTGSLIARFGMNQVMLAGCALMIACPVIALQGVTLNHFVIALAVLGIGWNFLFTGATAMITSAKILPEAADRRAIQGLNEFCIFATMITSSFSSGALLDARGWTTLNWIALPIMIGMTLVLLLMVKTPTPKAA